MAYIKDKCYKIGRWIKSEWKKWKEEYFLARVYVKKERIEKGKHLESWDMMKQ